MRLRLILPLFVTEPSSERREGTASGAGRSLRD